ncbi:hypothetical protein CGUA_07750 [Corynebacterium guangdongense]|nr:hypothetical protein CGUA_07750 [Corynebacterium guangdongense]
MGVAYLGPQSKPCDGGTVASLARMAPRKTAAERAAEDLATAMEKMNSWPEPYPAVAAALHATIGAVDDRLTARLWYGGVGYALGPREPVLVFFRVDEDLMSIGTTEKSDLTPVQGAELIPAAWYLRATEPVVADSTLEEVSGVVRRALGRSDS